MAKSLPEAEPTPNLRLCKFLADLAARGITQQMVAERTGTPPQYVSNVKKGWKPVSELFARRLEREYGIDRDWLLGKVDSAAEVASEPWVVATPEKIFLPILPWPIEGNPRRSPDWDGSLVEISGAPAQKIAGAADPYVLRYQGEDRRGRLQRNDLVLISQSESTEANIYIVKTGDKLLLARRLSGSEWEAVTKGKRLTGPVTAVGYGLGIVWGLL